MTSPSAGCPSGRSCGCAPSGSASSSRGRPATCCRTEPPSTTSASPTDPFLGADVGDLLKPLELLDALGLAAVADRPIPLLAGGEQQRVALAVAVANGPGLLLADEPTSQLDHDGREAVLSLLDVVNERFGTTIVVVTHDAEVGAHLGRAVSMRYGRIGLEEAGDEDFVVIDRDGSVHLPDALLADWPPGTQVVVERDGASVRLTRRSGE